MTGMPHPPGSRWLAAGVFLLLLGGAVPLGCSAGASAQPVLVSARTASSTPAPGELATVFADPNKSGAADVIDATDPAAPSDPDSPAPDDPAGPSDQSDPPTPTPSDSASADGPQPTGSSTDATAAPQPEPSGSTSASTEPITTATGTTSASPSSTTASPSPSPTLTQSPSAVPRPTPPPQRPATQPAAANSNIPLPMVVIALLVLAIAGAVVWVIAGRARKRPGPVGVSLDDTLTLPVIPTPSPPRAGPPPTNRPATPETQTMSFLVALGQAMVESGDPVTHVNASLEKIAAANGVRDAEILVMPTAMFVSVPSGDSVQTEVAAAGRATLRLDQVDAVFEVAEAAENGRISPAQGLALLADARSAPPTFSRRAQWLGYMGFTLGLSMIMMASPTEMALAVVLGAGVGLLDWWASRFPQPFQVFLPVVSAFAVALAVFLLGRAGLDVSGFSSLLAPLVILIPGALLTTGVIELATGQIISGSARLAAGLMRLTLLALGILAAGQLVGVPATNAGTVAANPLGQAGQWLGVAVFGVGIVINRCARRQALPWILLVLYVAYAGQVVGGLLFGEELAAFAGAALMTPVAMFVASQRSGPTTMVTFLPGFWLLVPGAVGLAGVTRLLGDNQELGLETMVTMGATMVSIALGVLLGVAVVGAWAYMRQAARGRAATGLARD